jgi:hypothetical protein
MLAALRGILQGIRTTKNYRTNVDMVLNYDPAASDEPTVDISIGVFTQNYRVDGQLTKLFAPECMATLIVGCRGRIRGSAADADPKKSELIADMEFALWSNISLGLQTNAIRLVSVDFQNESVQQYMAGAYAQFLAQVTFNFVVQPTADN